MEGTANSARLKLTRPTSRPIAPRASGTTNNRHAPDAPVAASITVSSTLPTPAQAPATPRFSQLTPVYKSTPVNAPADIARPRVKGIDFVKSAAPKPPVVATVSHAIAQPSHRAAIELPRAAQPNDSLTPRVDAKQFEYAAHNLDSIDLDQAEVTTDSPSSSTSGIVDHSIAAEIALQAAADSDAPDFLHHYFKHNAAKDASKTRKIKNAHKAAKAKFAEKISQVKHVRHFGMASVLVGVIAISGYVVADSFFINQQAKAVLAVEAKPALIPALQEEQASSAPAATKAVVPEETSQQTPPAGTGAGYSVSADQPKTLKIQKLGINAPVVGLGLTTAGAVDTPDNIWNAGWYNGSSKPGTNGAAFIDGHSSASRGALFGNLDQLIIGDQIQVERGDGSLLTYRVAHTATVDRNAVDMASMMKPYGGAARGLNIITCVGKWIDSEKTLENRVLVYAQQV